jgi:hypothetical protein
MTKKSGRITDINDDGKAGVIEDVDGQKYPFTSAIERLKDDVVLFEVEEKDFGNNIKSSFAKLD